MKQLPKKFSIFLFAQSLGAFNDNFFKMLLQLTVLQVMVSQHAEGIISQANMVFTIPFVIFGPWAGYVADRFAKSSVIRYVKYAEVGVMLLGLFAFYLSSLPWMLAVLFLMSTQSAFFGPAKYGYIPETCKHESITAANSWVGMTTFVSIILGTAITGLLFSWHGQSGVILAIYAIAIAIVGAISVRYISPTRPSGTDNPFPWNPVSAIFRDLGFLRKQKSLFLAAMANSYFWMIGLIFQTNILIFGRNMLGTDGSSVLLSLLPAFIGIGVAAGSMLANRWSGKKVELGLVPLGGIGLAISGIALWFSTASYGWTAAILLFAGMCGGLYYVPLYAFLQAYSKDGEKGRVLASAGIMNGIALVCGTFLHRLLAVELALAPEVIFITMGFVTLAVVTIICAIIPEYFFRFLGWLMVHTFYKVEVRGEEHIPQSGPALLTPNHVTYIDSLLVNATMQRFIRFVMLKEYYELPFANRFFRLMKAIPISPRSPREEVAASLDRARQELAEDHTVCIFPEGKVTRDGELNPFKRGCETILQGLSCPIIPVYIHNAWGSIFSFERGKLFWKRPRGFRNKITICFGDPLPANCRADEIEAAVRRIADNFRDHLRPQGDGNILLT